MATTAKPKSSKRDALIDTAKALLWERGFEAMSPKAVLQHSGAGQGSLYHHFEGKRDLAATALEQINAEAQADLARRIHLDMAPLERIFAYLDAPRDGLKGCRFGRLANEQVVFDPILGPIVADFFRSIEEHLVRAVKDAKKSGDLPSSLKSRKTARALIATVQGGYVLSRVHNDADALHDAILGAKALLSALAKR